MKKFFISALAMTAMASAAEAGPLNLDLRLDYSGITYDKAAVPDSDRFYLRTGRIDYQGKAFEDVSFRVRLSFGKPTTQLGTDFAQQAVEFAYVTQKFNDMFSLTMGKMNTDVGGFEGNTSGSDLYLLSTNYSLFTGSVAAGNFGGTDPNKYYSTSNMLYMTGAKLTTTFADGTNSIQLMGMNEKNDEGSGTQAVDQNSVLVGAVYKGAFLDKALNFILSYHTMNGPITDSKYQFMAAGVMWSADPVAISVDYLLNDEKNKTPVDGKNELSSIVVKAAYTGFEQWVPRLDFFSSERKDELSALVDSKWTGYGAVLEYKPYNDKNFRYHVAYNYTKESPDGAADDIIRQEIIFGTRFLGDFLK